MQAKHETCLICGQKLPFCNSHTVPQFCLKNIADNGKVNVFDALIGTKLCSSDSGIKSSGTFHVICRKCDGTIFQDYENPEVYSDIPSNKILNQIALKMFFEIFASMKPSLKRLRLSKRKCLKKAVFCNYCRCLF